MRSDCVFCRIVAGEERAELLYHGPLAVAFPDRHPIAETHILIVPREHIESALHLHQDNLPVVGEMLRAVQYLVAERKLEGRGFRVFFNGGIYQHVPHLHWHLISGAKTGPSP